MKVVIAKSYYSGYGLSTQCSTPEKSVKLATDVDLIKMIESKEDQNIIERYLKDKYGVKFHFNSSRVSIVEVNQPVIICSVTNDRNESYEYVRAIEGVINPVPDKLLDCLEQIMQMCIGQVAMNYSLDGETIGQLIYKATGMSAPELTARRRELQPHIESDPWEKM